MVQEAPRAVDTPQQADFETQLDLLTDRVDQLDRRNLQLKNTIRALAREYARISLGGVCPHCAQSLTLIEEGLIRCPECGYLRSL